MTGTQALSGAQDGRMGLSREQFGDLPEIPDTAHGLIGAIDRAKRGGRTPPEEQREAMNKRMDKRLEEHRERTRSDYEQHLANLNRLKPPEGPLPPSPRKGS